MKAIETPIYFASWKMMPSVWRWPDRFVEEGDTLRGDVAVVDELSGDTIEARRA